MRDGAWWVRTWIAGRWTVCRFCCRRVITQARAWRSSRPMPRRSSARNTASTSLICAASVAAVLGDGHEPHSTVGRDWAGVRRADGPSSWSTTAPIDGSADAETVGELGLGRGTELGDVAEQARLGEVDVERGETGVEGTAHESCRRHQGRFDPEPRRRVEFVVVRLGRVTTIPHPCGSVSRRRDPSGYILYVSLQRSPSPSSIASADTGDCRPGVADDHTTTLKSLPCPASSPFIRDRHRLVCHSSPAAATRRPRRHDPRQHRQTSSTAATSGCSSSRSATASTCQR